jgi:hypothetical protein
MGVIFHYKGKINKTSSIEPFCEELEDIARSMD